MPTTADPAPAAAVRPACPACSSTALAYDWDAIISIRVGNAGVAGVTVGGVLGVPPDRYACQDCGETGPTSEHPAGAAGFDRAAVSALEPLRASLRNALEDGFDLYPDGPRL